MAWKSKDPLFDKGLRKNLSLCFWANADSSCSPHGHGRKQREQFVLWRPRHSYVCFIWVGHVFGFLGSCRLLQIVLIPGENCTCVSHMLDLDVLCRGYSVQGWALPSVVPYTFRLFCHWPAGFQLYSCWLPAVSWIPPSAVQSACDSSLKLHVWLEDWYLSSNISPSFASFSDLSSTFWQQSPAVIGTGTHTHTHIQYTHVSQVCVHVTSL